MAKAKKLTIEDYAPKNTGNNIKEKCIGYCYPTSPRAGYFDAAETGGFFVSFNKDTAHTGIFKTLEEAEAWADEKYPDVPYGFWSMGTKMWECRSSDGEVMHVHASLKADTAEEALGCFLIRLGVNFETAKFFTYKNEHEREPYLCFEGSTDRFSVRRQTRKP